MSIQTFKSQAGSLSFTLPLFFRRLACGQRQLAAELPNHTPILMRIIGVYYYAERETLQVALEHRQASRNLPPAFLLVFKDRYIYSDLLFFSATNPVLRLNKGKHIRGIYFVSLLVAIGNGLWTFF